MKNVPWTVWVVFLLVAGTGWGLWIHDKLAKPAPAPLPAVTQATNRFTPPAPYNNSNAVATNMPTRNEWQEYSMTRQKILQTDPDLSAEYKELLIEIQAQQQKINAAMIQADPKVAPIIAKLEAMRQRSMAMQGGSHSTPPATTPSPTR